MWCEFVDELRGVVVVVVVLPRDLVDEEVKQRQSRSARPSVDQLRQRRHPEPHRVAGVAALHAVRTTVGPTCKPVCRLYFLDKRPTTDS